MAARRAQGPGKPVTGMVMAVAAAAAGYAVYKGFPGLALIWAGLLVSAWTYPPAMFTGRKDSRGYPTPADPGEQAAMLKYRFWSDLKLKLVVPNMDWLPGLKPRLSFLAALWAGAAAWFIPVTDVQYMHGYGPWIDAAAAFASVVQLTASRRRHQVPDDENPGAGIDSLIILARKEPGKVAALTIGGIVLGAVTGTVASVLIPVGTRLAGLPAVPEPAIWALFLTGGPLLLISRPWVTEALAHWRVVVEARDEWKPRWEMLKQDPAPRLIDREEVGTAIVDTFDAPGSTGAMTFWSMAAKITPTLGGGTRLAVLDTPNLDSNNQPMPGTTHPLRFQIVRWPSDQLPDVSDASTPAEVVKLLARCALAWMVESLGCGRPILDDVYLLTTAGQPDQQDEYPDDDADLNPDPEAQAAAPAGPAAWAMTWYAPMGPPATYIRQNRDALAGSLNSQVLVDHRAANGAGCAYFGALSDPGTVWDPQSGVTAETIANIADEDTWNERWEQSTGQGVNPPVIQHPTAATARLKNGVVIRRVAFVTRQGMTPHDFFKVEGKLPSTLNAAPFLAMTGWPGQGQRPGERHPQAFAVYWSSEAVPARPDDLAPMPRGNDDGPRWVLAGRINEAFRAARLADRPEIASAVCLTKPESRKHIWKIDLRLYGGVTLADVRGAAQKIRQQWGAEWMRIAAAPDGCTIVVGARPSKVKLAEARHERYLEALNWDQVFLDSGLSGSGGLLPTLTGVDHMPRNEQVAILDFDLPAGLTYEDLRGKVSALQANSNNTYVEVRRVRDRANQVQLYVSEVSPMPEHAPYDYPAILNFENIPFATGVEGEPVEFDIRRHIHFMIVGGSGSGKSVILQALITGALIRDCDIYIADPTKGAADFTFAEPYASAFCKDLLDTGAMMKGLYREVQRRVELNSTYGVGSYRDLPETVRPRHIVVVLDEFTSLISPDAVSKTPSDDPEVEAEREMGLAINAAKAEVGAYTGKIAREARSAGVTLLLATQKLTQKDLDNMPGGSTLKVNLSRLIAGKTTPGERMSALKDAMNAPSLGDSIPPGRAIFEPVTSGPVMIQCWYDKGEQAALAGFVGQHRQPLDEDEKLDLAKYRRKVPGQDESGNAVVDLGELELQLEDLDLGEFELSLDDLEDEDTDHDESEDAAEAARETEPDQVHDQISAPVAADDLPAADGSTTAMFLDVDGCIAPLTHRPNLTKLAVPGHGTIAYDPTLVSRLAALPVTQAWLTSWEDDAPEHLGNLFPDARDVITGSSEDHGWWKIDGALAWLAEHPGVRRVVWIDDELATEDPVLGVRFQDIAVEAFTDAGVELLAVATDANAGIGRVQVPKIEAFCHADQHPAPAQAPTGTGNEPETAGAAEPDWEELEADFAAPAATQPSDEDLFATDPFDEDPFGTPEPVPARKPARKRPVPPVDEDDPFA